MHLCIACDALEVLLDAVQISFIYSWAPALKKESGFCNHPFIDIALQWLLNPQIQQPFLRPHLFQLLYSSWPLPLSLSSFPQYRTFLYFPTVSPIVSSVSIGFFSSFWVLKGHIPEGFVFCPFLFGPQSPLDDLWHLQLQHFYCCVLASKLAFTHTVASQHLKFSWVKWSSLYLPDQLFLLTFTFGAFEFSGVLINWLSVGRQRSPDV